MHREYKYESHLLIIIHKYNSTIVSDKDHTDILLEEIEYFACDNELYKVLSRSRDHIVIRANKIDVEGFDKPIPVGFHLGRIMGMILGVVMPYGTMQLKTVHTNADDPMDDKITLEFDITSSGKHELRYKGLIEVVK